jgi:beta-glucanase (GH16 family)
MASTTHNANKTIMTGSIINRGQTILVPLGILLLVLISLAACEKEAKQSLPDRSWQLTWADEFDGAAGTAPDASKWSFDIGTGTGGWGNAELQYYTNRSENVSHDGNGNLVITARKETYASSGYTSGRIKTKGLFEQAYGRFEARIQTTYGPGLWPAFWMLGADIDVNPWPQCGEIDIMEQRGQEPNITHGSIHGPGYSGANAITKAYGLPNGRFDTDFHVYAVEWGEDYIDYYVDDFLYKRISPQDVPGVWVYDRPFFLILNVAVGGNFVGFPNDNTPFPQTMLIDYVKVYKQQ